MGSTWVGYVSCCNVIDGGRGGGEKSHGYNEGRCTVTSSTLYSCGIWARVP